MTTGRIGFKRKKKSVSERTDEWVKERRKGDDNALDFERTCTHSPLYLLPAAQLTLGPGGAGSDRKRGGFSPRLVS